MQSYSSHLGEAAGVLSSSQRGKHDQQLPEYAQACVDKDQFIQRIDLNESSNSSGLGGTAMAMNSSVTAKLCSTAQPLHDRSPGMLSNTRVLSPSMVNELRLGVQLFLQQPGTEAGI